MDHPQLEAINIVSRLNDQYMATYHAAFEVNPETARRQLLHGLARRLMLIAENTRVIIDITRPNRVKPLSDSERVTASIHLNSFYLHVRGSLDNLAWALTYQLALLERDASGEPKRRQDVDLFGPRFLKALEEKAPALFAAVKPKATWRKELAGLRDPVAHRIPIYAIPTTLNREEQELYQRTDAAAKEAFAAMDIYLANTLHDKLAEIGTYKALFAHDFSSPQGIREIYPQVLHDAQRLLKLCDLIVSAMRKS